MKFKFYLLLLLMTFSVCLDILHGQSVVINEVFVNPPGTVAENTNSLYNTGSDAQPPDNMEYIELYNPSTCNSVDISCFTLGSNMQPSLTTGGADNWGAFTFPAGTVIPPLGFIIIGGNHAPVPVLDFNITNYRQTSFGVSNLCGDFTRWFLRDLYGWIALYDVSGAVVDAVYWDADGFPGNLFSQNEYAQPVQSTTTCSGSKTFAAAKNIPGIEYAGKVIPGTSLSFQRVTDGSNAWKPQVSPLTPRACNGVCVHPPILQFILKNESCAGHDGKIHLHIVDGYSGPYTITWINPAGVHDSLLSALSAGMYVVSVTDAYNCVVSDTVNLIKNPDPSITLVNLSHETCDSQNGSITISVANGTAPISYLWNTLPVSTGTSIQHLDAGIYTVSIIDSLGCTDTLAITVNDFPGPVLSIDSIKNEMCSETNGAVYVELNGGTAPFNYLWNCTPPQNTQNLINVSAGNYLLSVTDHNGCTATVDTTLTNTPPPIIQIDHIEYDTCNKRTGAIFLHAIGGSPPYYYSWTSDITNHTGFLTHLSEGTYQISVSDSNCTVSQSINIINIPGPQADFTFHPPVAVVDNAHIRFEDLSTGIINYWLWDFGDLMSSTDENPIHTYQEVGTYTVMLRISNNFGCVDSVFKKVPITEQPCLYVPNAFTPNGNGSNEIFLAKGINIVDFTMYIYNRWGELVFTSDDMNKGWDGTYRGKLVEEGVYSYVIFYSENFANVVISPQFKKGIVTVIH